MKILTPWKGLLSSLLLLMIILSACKKNKPVVVSPPELLGNWTEDMPFDDSSRLPRNLLFLKEKIVFMTSNQVSRQVTSVEGIYRTEGNKLITNFTEIVVSQNNGGIISRTTVNGNYFQNATYVMSERKLTINFTGNPSNGTMPSTMNFNRVFPD